MRPNLKLVEPLDVIADDMDDILNEWANMDKRADRFVKWLIAGLVTTGVLVRLAWAVWG